MKSLLGRLGVILIGLTIFGYAEVWGADWKPYSDSENFLFFFDASSITRPSKNVVRVWERMDFTEKGVTDCVRNLGKKYENVSHTIELDEINCIEKKARRLSLTYYDNKGEVIHTSNSPSEWKFVTPETVGESLYKAVCK